MALAAHVFAVVGIGLAVTGRNRSAVVGGIGLAVLDRNRRAIVVGIGLAVLNRSRSAVVGSVGLAVLDRNRTAVVVGIGLAVVKRSRRAALGGHCVGGGVREAGAISLLDLCLALVAHAHVWTLCRGHPTDGHHQCHRGCHRHQQKHAPHKHLPFIRGLRSIK